jgi:phenylalanyl-tRNA synthetase beta chain
MRVSLAIFGENGVQFQGYVLGVKYSMKLTWSWLNDLISPCCSAQECAKLLTRSGTETHIFPLYAWAKEVRIVRIVQIDPHPNANSLNLCTVYDGAQNLTVVCGAPNVREGMKVVLLQPGQYLPGASKPLAPAVIRGVESAGMLCSAQELNLVGVFNTTEEDGLLEISPDICEGTALGDILPEDWILDCEITPNRGDLMSAWGIARELVTLDAARNFSSLAWLNSSAVCDIQASSAPEVRITTPACRQFYIATVHQTTKNPYHAPSYVTRRLRDLGMGLVHDVVDALNYYTHTFGTPFHVFDGNALQGTLTLETLEAPEPFQGLNDGVEESAITLPEGALVLRDQSGIVALSGILGAERGKALAQSQKLYIEAAEFDPKVISLAGQKTRRVTSARMRFERGIDSPLVKHHLVTALRWMRWSAVTVNTVRPYAAPNTPDITLSVNHFKRVTGCTYLSVQDMACRLQRNGCWVEILEESEDTLLKVTLPTAQSVRHDLTIAEDLMEEILRMNGYEDVPSVRPYVERARPLTSEQHRIQEARQYLVHQGLGEAVTWSFISAKHARDFSDLNPEVLCDMTLLNPLAKDMAVMRPSILSNLVDLALTHYHKKVSFQGRFECGPVFFGGQPKDQRQVISGVIPGKLPEAWGRTSEVSFFDLKRLLEGLFAVWGIQDLRYVPVPVPWMHPGQCAQIWADTHYMGIIGTIHPNLTETRALLGFEIIPGAYADCVRTRLEVFALQPVEKDLSFFLNDGTVGDIMLGLKQQDPNLTEVCLVDRFEKEGRVSITVRCTFQPRGQAWSSQEIHQRLERIVKWAHHHGAELRGNALFAHL